MHGLSVARHKQMNDALWKLEQLMKARGDVGSANEIGLRRRQLDEYFDVYTGMLETLSDQILVYEKLYSDIKANQISKKLLMLKKKIKPLHQNFEQLIDVITSHYGT